RGPPGRVSRLKDEYLPLNRLGRDYGFAAVDEEIHLAPNPKVLQVNSRLHGYERPLDQASLVAGLEIVQMDPVPVYFLPDRMPGPVNEAVAETLGADRLTRHVVHVASSRLAARAEGIAHEADRRVPRFANCGERGLMGLGRSRSEVRDLGGVGIDGTRTLRFGPGRENTGVPGGDGTIVGGPMRIVGVG